MEKLTIKQYADRAGITVQAAHKRINTRHSDIKSIEEVTPKLFLIKVKKVTSKGA